MAPNLLVYDTDGERIGIVENIDTVQWMLEYQDVGEIKIICSYTDKNRELLQQWNTVYNVDTPGIAAEITYVQQAMNKTGKLQLEVRGTMSVARWNRRMVYGSSLYSNAVSGILDIASANQRGLPIFVGDAGFFAACGETVGWCQCVDAFIQLATAGGVGFRDDFDPDSGAEMLSVYRGISRVAGTATYRGYFGTDMQNISDVKIVQNGSSYYNVAICRGGTNESHLTPFIVTVGNVIGPTRRELYVDCSSVEFAYQDADGKTQSYTDEQYKALLENKGLLALLDHYNAQSLTGTVVDTALVFGADYGLGDILPVRIKELCIYAKARVDAVKITYDKSGRTVEPSFGNFTILEG